MDYHLQQVMSMQMFVQSTYVAKLNVAMYVASWIEVNFNYHTLICSVNAWVAL